QEEHLPHEAWHVVQQKQGRVQATTNLHGKAVNEDAALEAESDKGGQKALAGPAAPAPAPASEPGPAAGSSVIQRVKGKLALVDNVWCITGDGPDAKQYKVMNSALLKSLAEAGKVKENDEREFEMIVGNKEYVRVLYTESDKAANEPEAAPEDPKS